MREVMSVRSRLGSAIGCHESRSALFAVGRSALAGAQLGVPLFNSDTTLFADSPAVPGEYGAVLLIPVCLADNRTWQWSPAREPLPAAWRGCSFAATQVLRLQVAVIYLVAATAKLSDPAWYRAARSGSWRSILNSVSHCRFARHSNRCWRPMPS
ncbi:hypothetical protein [Amycolatopsis sp. cmx-4-61]|uniref:hypothetical protein n=1 Tax=Amycolatopsis sp. cmx-4-61 TaxID=2790937 RepID=UPI00397AB44D